MKRNYGKSRILTCFIAIVVGFLAWVSATAFAQSIDSQSAFITLGTKGGPAPDPKRSQPANLLRYEDQAILVDVGDGAAEQLAKVGVPLNQIRTIFLSHLHFDHTGGLFGFLGLRFQVRSPGIVTIYGPPGTKRLMEGLIEAMQPGAEVGGGWPGQVRRSPEDNLRVVEIGEGDKIIIGSATVTSTVNTHYSFEPESDEAARFQSLSFRFDLPDRSIVFTGDTGESANVEKLAQGADLLVSEIVDPDVVVKMKRANPNLAPALEKAGQRIIDQHLTPEQVGLLANNAGVGQLVITHNALSDEAAQVEAKAVIASIYSGTVIFANDLDQF